MTFYRVYIPAIDEKGIVYDSSIPELRKRFPQFNFVKVKFMGKIYYSLYRKEDNINEVGTVERWTVYQQRMREMGMFPFYEDLWNKRGDI